MGYLESLLGEGEQIGYATRRHWTALLAETWGLLLLLVVGLALAGASNLLAGPYLGPGGLGLSQELQLAARAAFVVVLLVYPVAALLVRWIRWRADRLIVTNLRVIQLQGVLAKSVLDSSLEKVNDVMLRQSFAGRLLDFGDVEILTSSEIGVNKLTHISHPLAFKRAMLNAKQQLESSQRPGLRSIPQLIAELAQLREQGVLTEQEFQAQKAELLERL